ncbi:PRC-barrel domain-containing protein [Chelativorans sp. AA-79]|uniref:PRC-barrel domain-containing protein n=1 Tax=Chelativorans sp. AA-79 TaxID=3028735 RepID=UPI0023F6D295|nr:PRC-barrel domain-containing protein [Chelativorans sp. AA-79]WEX10639.1 PRC-barrel domain-containing protein [Chelativorans sp. AA-79]
MRRMKTSTALALVLALAPATALAVEAFSDLDTDGNQELTNAEFEQASRGVFQAWDENQDQRLTENELYRGMFTAWDQNNNDQLNQDEYSTGYTAWFGSDAQPGFQEVSGDDDTIAQDEFVSAFSESDVMAFDTGEEGADWAAFNAALFNIYDQNGSDTLAQDEYAQVESIRQSGGSSQAQSGNQAQSTNQAQSDVDRTEQTAAVNQGDAIQAEVIALPEWRSDNLYADGISVDYVMDEAEVYGPGGDEIGSVENFVFAEDGRVLSIVAEVGGFWDLFDTHVNVPWEEVTYSGGRLTILVTEDNVEDYSLFKTGYLTAQGAAGDTTVVEDDLATGPRSFRASELIGDYARIRADDQDNYANYGYVNDLILRDGQIAAVVVNPNAGYGTPGPYAYPYYGYGWAPGMPYYDMPYGEQDVAQAERFDYDRLGN